MFAGMFKGQYDVCEMSLGELIYYTSRAQSRLRRDSGFSLADVSPWLYFLPQGCRDHSAGGSERHKIGFLRWVQTAAIWMRGMLVDEYGVSAKNSQWYVASMHHWDEHDPGATVEPRDGSVIRVIENGGKKHPSALATRCSTAKSTRWV